MIRTHAPWSDAAWLLSLHIVPPEDEAESMLREFSAAQRKRDINFLGAVLYGLAFPVVVYLIFWAVCLVSEGWLWR